MFRVDPRQAVIEHIKGSDETGSSGLTPEAEAIASGVIEPGYSHKIVSGLAQLIEAGLLVACGLAIYAYYVGPTDVFFYVPLIMGAVLLANVFFNAARTYRIVAYRTMFKQLLRVLIGWSAVFFVIMAGLFVFKAGDQVSRVWLTSWFATGVVALAVFRLAFRSLILR